ncbi:hypothetical protein N9W44_01555 [Alphaproteobacteria bacterium]|nr:hypothetical protein [Alphaproteobacteria bacterium]
MDASKKEEHSRPKVELLIPVWGQDYIGACLSGTVSSILADNNLPKLAMNFSVSIVFLTRETDAKKILASPLIKKARKYATCVSVYIDDLTQSNAYGVVLTLALTRAIKRHGSRMTEINFLPIMSDFIFADGALGALAKPINEGYSAIFAPSWRANESSVCSVLSKNFLSGDVLSVAPRELANIALTHPHITLLAGMVEDGVLCTSHYNQFFWSVGQNTILSRQFLMHLICIRPETVLADVNYFFDYGLFQACCPSGNYCAITDSDEYMVLESQSSTWQQDRISWGVHSPKAIASNLASWTTSVHRLVSRHTCVLHSSDLPIDIKNHIEKTDRFMKLIMQKLPLPLQAENHHYWLGAYAAWTRDLKSVGTSLPDFGGQGAPLNPKLLRLPRLRQHLLRLAFGKGFFLPFWNPKWIDNYIAKSIIEPVAKHHRSIVFVPNHRKDFDDAFAYKDTRFPIASLSEIEQNFEVLIIQLGDSDTHDIDFLFENSHRILAGKGHVVIVAKIDNSSRSQASLLLSNLNFKFSKHGWANVNTKASGTPYSNLLILFSRECLASFRTSTTIGERFIALTGLATASMLSIIMNVFALFFPKRALAMNSVRQIVFHFQRCQDQSSPRFVK